MPNKFADILKFSTPARWWGEKWREGLYLGNGKMGSNVYGGASEEKILFNDATLFWRGRTTVVPDVSDRIEETKRKIEEGDFLGAQNVIGSALKQKNFRPQAAYPLPLCELDLLFDQEDVTRNFRRVLDMENGEATVTYDVGDTHYKRCAFVSRADNLFAYRITKQGNGTINVKLSLQLMHRVNSHTYEGLCDLPEGVSVSYDRQFMCFAARNDDNGFDYGAVARLHVLGGSVRAESDCVKITHAIRAGACQSFFGSLSRKGVEQPENAVACLQGRLRQDVQSARSTSFQAVFHGGFEFGQALRRQCGRFAVAVGQRRYAAAVGGKVVEIRALPHRGGDL